MSIGVTYDPVSYTHLNDNAQSEYYLPDVLGILKGKGHYVSIYQTEDATEILGVNDRVQLAQMNKMMKERILDKIMRDGVTIIDPASTFIAPGVKIGMDTVIHPGSILNGNTVVGENCVIGPMTRLEDMRVADGVKIVNSVCMQSEIGEDTTVGPFAYIRPNCKIGSKVCLLYTSSISCCRPYSTPLLFPLLSKHCQAGDSRAM